MLNEAGEWFPQSSRQLARNKRFHNRPQLDVEWMMQTQHEETPPAPAEDLLDAVDDGMEQLTPEHQYILRAIFHERISLQELGNRLGVSKTHAWRLRDHALTALRDQLGHHPTITERYDLYANWNEAAASNIASMARNTKPTRIEGDQLRKTQQTIAGAIKNVNPESLAFKDAWVFYELGANAIRHLKFLGLWDEEVMLDLLVAKQHDYGHDNINLFGLIGIGVRVSDKLARLLNLDGVTNAVVGETPVDSWWDLVGYSVVAAMFIDETFQLQLADDAAVAA